VLRLSPGDEFSLLSLRHPPERGRRGDLEGNQGGGNGRDCTSEATRAGTDAPEEKTP
jgi:hypothetical protein